MASKQAEENELGAQCASGGSGVKGGGARSKRREARGERTGSQLRFCTITGKTSFASGNGIQTCASFDWY